ELVFGCWRERIEELLEPIARLAVWPVVKELTKRTRRLVIVPNWVLHLFPIHACRMEDGQTLIEKFDEVIFTPSLSVLHRCAGIRRELPSRLLTVENPTKDLDFTDVAMAFVRRHFREHAVLRGDQANRLRLLAEGANHDVWHYSGHSIFRPENP